MTFVARTCAGADEGMQVLAKCRYIPQVIGVVEGSVKEMAMVLSYVCCAQFDFTRDEVAR